MMITTVTLLLVALSALNTNIIYQQQEALATQEDTSEPTSTDAACGEVVEGLVELNSDLDCSGDGLIVGADEMTVRLNGHTIMGPGRDSSKVGV